MRCDRVPGDLQAVQPAGRHGACVAVGVARIAAQLPAGRVGVRGRVHVRLQVGSRAGGALAGRCARGERDALPDAASRPVTRWLHEPLAPGLRRSWLLDEVLWAGDTGFQHVVIARTEQGVTLFCDGERQSSELGQLAYHEALLVPALLLAERVERVLVVGSSEGVVSQLAVAAGARTVDHVDIDRECVRRCAELLPYGYSAAELAAAERGDSPVRVHYADGWDFVAAASGFDVIVVDLPDERDNQTAQHNRLYGVEFLRRCAR